MTDIQNGPLGSVAIVKIAVPGEASTQHRGVVTGLDSNTITISQDGDNESVISTSYNLDYVVLVQWLSKLPTASAEVPN